MNYSNIPVYDMDTPAGYDAFVKHQTDPTFEEVLPRTSSKDGHIPFIYGDNHAIDSGLEPLEAYPQVLLEPDQLRDAVDFAHEHQTMPVYNAQDQWRPEGFLWNQNGLGYCWTWSGTGSLMTCRAMEDKPLVYLAPVSMGYLVRWRNAGNYLDSFIKGAREDGICPAVNGEYNSHNNSASYWSQHDTDRHLYRIDKTWDTNPQDMDRHCISILTYGRSLYAAWNRLSHAMEILDIFWNNGWNYVISNSHNKPTLLIMKGSSATPSEAIGIISSK